MKRDRECAGTRADFEDACAAVVERQRCNALRDRFIDEKMLAEPFLRAQSAGSQLLARFYFRMYTCTGRAPNSLADADESNPKSMRFPRMAPPVSPAIAGP